MSWEIHNSGTLDVLWWMNYLGYTQVNHYLSCSHHSPIAPGSVFLQNLDEYLLFAWVYLESDCLLVYWKLVVCRLEKCSRRSSLAFCCDIMMLNSHDGSFVTDQMWNGEMQTFMCHFLFMHNFIMLLNICIIIMRHRWVFHRKVQNISMPLFHAVASKFWRFFLADGFDDNGWEIFLLSPFWVTCLWIYRLIHRTDSFLVNCADLEYTNKILFQISWWMMLFWSLYKKCKQKFQSIIILNQSARLLEGICERNVFKLLFMCGQFVGVKLL